MTVGASINRFYLNYYILETVEIRAEMNQR